MRNYSIFLITPFFQNAFAWTTRQYFGSDHTSKRFHDLIEESKIEEAMQCFREGQKELKKFPMGSKKNIDDNHQFLDMYFKNSQLDPEDRKIIIDAASKMRSLLKNTNLCLDLLKKLDRDIAQYSKFTNCGDFSKITPGNPIQFNNSFYLPAPPNKTLQLIPDTHHLHLFLMREELKTQGIETQSEVYKFFGFVDREHANSIVRNGSLFTEEANVGTLLIHGIDTHFFHWYLFSRGFSTGVLRFNNNLITLHTMMKNLVDTHPVAFSKISMWDILIDHYINSKPNMPFLKFPATSPYYLNMLLLLSPKIPYLRGYMLNQWYLNIAEIQKLYFATYKEELPYECLVGAHAVSRSRTDGISFFSKKDLMSNMQRNEVPFIETNMPGVYYQNANLLFSKAKQLQQHVLENKGGTPKGAPVIGLGIGL